MKKLIFLIIFFIIVLMVYLCYPTKYNELPISEKYACESWNINSDQFVIYKSKIFAFVIEKKENEEIKKWFFWPNLDWADIADYYSKCN